MSDDDYLVQNAVGYLVEDLNSDDRYEGLGTVERDAVLAWVSDGLIRGDGMPGWIESLGQRADDAVVAVRAIGAQAHADVLVRAVALFPTRHEADADRRLAAMGSWTERDVRTWRELEDRYLQLGRQDDLVDGYVRPFVLNHPEAFPPTVDSL